MRHVRTSFAFSSTHAQCIKSVAYILLSVDVPVLLYYRLLYAVTFNVKKLLFKHLHTYNGIVYI